MQRQRQFDVGTFGLGQISAVRAERAVEPYQSEHLLTEEIGFARARLPGGQLVAGTARTGCDLPAVVLQFFSQGFL